MQKLDTLSLEEARALYRDLQSKYNAFKQRGLQLNMARGVPAPDQLDLSEELLTAVPDTKSAFCGKVDTRSYGVLEGIDEARALMASILEAPADRVFIGGSSSLNLMFDAIARAMTVGVVQGQKPWSAQGGVKFLCPAPGYDRHFSILAHFGIEMIPVAMTEEGPDMNAVETLVQDEKVKGIWCVPKYQNPTGITFSDAVVDRLAALKPAAADFRIYWDNAYAVHDIYEPFDKLKSIDAACQAAGNPELVLQFTSTSKVSFPGGGISALSAGPETLEWIRKCMFVQTICFDKINQLRHVRYFGDKEGVLTHMKRHADILRPRFDMVEGILKEGLTGWATWTKPQGGYFMSLDVCPGTAKRTVGLLKEAGVLMTPAGATWPYGRDPKDTNIRIAPTFPPVEELREAMDLLCVCAKMAALETKEGVSA